MACMKCGRDTQSGQVFCENCLEVMEYYPVKPGTAVQLPKRRPTPVRKPVKRRAPSAEEQIRSLKRVIRWLVVFLIVLVLFAGLLAIPAYEHLFLETFRPGQNYSTVTHNSSTVSTTTGTTGG